MRIILLGVVGISDGRGNFIMDLVGELNLNILNDESCTCWTYVLFAHHTCIDLSFCSKSFSSWKKKILSSCLPILIEICNNDNRQTFNESLKPDSCKNVIWIKFWNLISLDNNKQFCEIIIKCLLKSQCFIFIRRIEFNIFSYKKIRFLELIILN